MKKILFVALVSLLMLGSCSRCSKEQCVEPEIQAELSVEECISLDKEYMALNYGEEYTWFETLILMDNYMDEDTVLKVESLMNIFQVAVPTESGTDTQVIQIYHMQDTTSVEVTHSFWLEDLALDSVVLTFDEALERAFEANYVNPHGRYCTLRRELGPKVINPQYIFGNVDKQIYVDAITGDVVDKDPAFME